MAVSPLGNLTYINQASSVTANLQANNITHPIPVNQQLFADALNQVQEVRPAEESEALNPDRDSAKHEFDEEAKEQLGEEPKPHKKYSYAKATREEDMLLKPDRHLLDISG
ncbi:hypothetical protein BKH43_03125 [Helicobacter sp. 13S00401-1]|uniref:hypothetical protein n=1 Tax=Helicobacter sp. 13S00401-1 TaxID=1905758 RepID=UPI000BA63536|nr:hypothetical protein [Helicobacter sp. 13S00401-1]PAF51210.1 hypothetical protein BKH43_03125 [Helicobacter sp. 13S00401-1]